MDGIRSQWVNMQTILIFKNTVSSEPECPLTNKVAIPNQGAEYHGCKQGPYMADNH